MVEPHERIKLTVIGALAVGKTCLISRFVYKRYSDTHVPTIGVDFMIHKFEHAGIPCRAMIWDTAGQERFMAISPTMIRATNIVFVVYDLTSTIEKIIHQINYWLEIVRMHVTDPTEVSIYLIGNKSDLVRGSGAAEIEVGIGPTIEKWSQLLETPIHHQIASAKQGYNVDTIFNQALHGYMDEMMDRLRAKFRGSNKKPSVRLEETPTESKCHCTN